MNAEPLTFWEESVGLTFNPGWNPDVEQVKRLFAAIIDLIDDRQKERASIEETHGSRLSRRTNVFYTAAFNAIIAAQMAVVKLLTRSWR